MASILFDSPIPYEGIATSRRREQALGADLASNMMQTYFQAQARRAEDERWDEELPLRNARLTQLAAQAANEKAEGQLNALKFALQARRMQSWADLAALQEESAMAGWDQASEGKFYNFMSRHPEFVGSPEAVTIGSQFDKARTARDAEEKWRTDYGSRLEAARIRSEGNLAGDTIPEGAVIRPWMGEDNQPVPGLMEMVLSDGSRQLLRVPAPATIPAGSVGQRIPAEEGGYVKGWRLIGGKLVREGGSIFDLFGDGEEVAPPMAPGEAGTPYTITPLEPGAPAPLDGKTVTYGPSGVRR